MDAQPTPSLCVVESPPATCTSIAKQQGQEEQAGPNDSEDMQEPLLGPAPIACTRHLENAAVLASRLRLERDKAVANLAFCSVENHITLETLESELQELRHGRDSLRNDLQEMVAKLIQGERAQRQLDELTGTLCQTESSYQQAKGRLATAYAELDDLRSRLPDASRSEVDTRPADNLPQCTCRASLDDLRKENASLKEELDLLQRQHTGSGNLVLSLQKQLDDATAKLKEVENNSRLHLQHSQDLQLQLDEQQRRNRDAQEIMDAERIAHEHARRNYAGQAAKLEREIKARQIAERAHTEQIDLLDEERKARRQAESALIGQTTMLDAERKAHRDAERTRIEHAETLADTLHDKCVQLKGAVNRTLALQTRLEEQEKALIATRKEKDASESRLAAMESSMLAQTKELSSVSTNYQSLQQEVDNLQTGLASLVLVHLQGRKSPTIRAHANHTQSLQKTPETCDDLLSMKDSAAVTVVLIEASKQISAFNVFCSTLRQKNSNLETHLEQMKVENSTLQSKLVDLADQTVRWERLIEENTALRAQASVVQAGCDRALEEAQTARLLAKATSATSAELARSLEDTAMTLTATQSQLKDSLAIIAELEKENQSTRESLRVAEEEGRNLVADFNMLSEELEHRQNEDETRSAHTADTERRLAEAAAKEEALHVRRIEDEAALVDLNERLRDLERDLEQMQISVEETDDKYLDSLKTIKKQSMLLDKLKVRNEALLRANALLDHAIPATASSPMAPAPNSARKRTLPKEFVAPDPGPTAVIATSSSSTDPRHDGIKSETRASTLIIRQVDTVTEIRKVIPLSGKDPNDQPLAETSKGLGTQAHKPLKHLRESAAKPIIPVVASRAPLAPVSTQKQSNLRSAAFEKDAPLSRKTGPMSLSSKTPFKPSPALNGRPLPKSAPSSDTRNLLAALHALKRPS